MCIRLPVFLTVSGILLASAVASAATLSAAIIDYQDTWSTTKGLGQTLTDLGQSYTDLTSVVQAGGPVNLAGYDTLIIGSFCTQNTTIQTVLANAGTVMNQFVNAGGTVIMLTQADQNRSQESWIASPAVVTRGDPDFATVYRVQPAHQLFASPHVIADADLQGWEYRGSSTWDTSWESFVTFSGVGVLAGDSASVVSKATIIEAGWGTGRVIFTSLAADKARNIGNAQAKAQALRLMANLVQYAKDVKDQLVAPIVIYEGGGYPNPITGRVFNDLDGDKEWDAGEPGVAGVGVSDTIDLVVTAANGTYTLPNTGKNATLLYICPPAGYAKNTTWHRAISKTSTAAHFSFALTAQSEGGDFDFVQITDIHTGASGTKALLIEALARVAALPKRPKLIFATGDLTNSGAAVSQYEDYVAGVATSAVPLFSVFGNHDADNSTSNNYRRYLGPDYYSVNYGDCHFLVINGVHKTAAQSAWIAADLALLRGNRKLFVFHHYAPTEAELAQYATWGVRAAFSGHWHSQHTVQAGQVLSYNTPTFLFGGIDCSPAGFKLISVSGDSVTTRMKWITNGRQLQIITPGSSQKIANADLPIVVNAYETEADTTSMTYQLRRGTDLVAAGPLQSEGDWSWRATVPQASLGAGSYSVSVQATNDAGSVSSVQTSFPIMAARRPEVIAGDPWPQFGGGPKRGGLSTSTIRPPLGVVWITYSGGTFDVGSPVLDGDTLFVGVKDRRDLVNNGVLALDIADGSKRWFAPTPAAVSHAVAVDDQRVYANSHGGILHAFDRVTGAPVWQKVLGSSTQRWAYGAPVVSGGQVYSGTYAYFGRFNAATGAEAWHQAYDDDWISCNASPATDGTIVTVPGNWAGYNLKGAPVGTGGAAWSYSCKGLHGSPVIAGDRVVFTDYDGVLHCALLTTGQQVWSMALGGGRSASTPAVSGNIVVAGGTGSVGAYRLGDGAQVWTYALGTSALKMAPYNNTFAALAGSPTIAGSYAYVPCGDGRLHVLDVATGAEAWSMDFGTPILSAPCISGDFLFLTTFDGHIYALADRSRFRYADLDDDGDVDSDDMAILSSCLGGTGLPIGEGCVSSDLDADGDADLADFGLFQRCVNGSNQPPAAGCGN
ncbi:MAG: PQQ-binding-like beta-propeller repeat protein [Phycisphaerae bacterium]|nr:PQQ-binding-like beta-propeller repeat protein [Phycisphaerae bacterium]